VVIIFTRHFLFLLMPFTGPHADQTIVPSTPFHQLAFIIEGRLLTKTCHVYELVFISQTIANT